MVHSSRRTSAVDQHSELCPNGKLDSNIFTDIVRIKSLKMTPSHDDFHDVAAASVSVSSRQT